jgi:hypothetical protein
MAYVYNPLLSVGLDKTGSGGGGTPGGADTQIQFNDDGSFGGSADLTWDDSGKVLDVGGDINLDDGGTYKTTLQIVTPATADRTITFPDATGTVALVAGSSGNLVVNQSGAYAGVANSSVDNATGNITLGSRFISSLNGAASAPPATLTGTWFTGGTATTTKPQLLLEPAGTTSTAWSTAGTGLGINATSGFTGRLLDAQVNGTSRMVVTGAGRLGLETSSPEHALDARGGSFAANRNFGIQIGTPAGEWKAGFKIKSDGLGAARTAIDVRADNAGGTVEAISISSAGNVGIGGTTSPSSLLHLADAGNITVGTTTGTKIGTATTQKLGFYNATPVVQPAAVTDITTVATAGTLPTADGSVTVADANAPTNAELLEYCVELEAKLEAALAHLRTLGLIAT